MSLTPVAGFSSPPVENIDSTKAALTTLVTRNRKAATTVADFVSQPSGNASSTKNVVFSGLPFATSRTGRVVSSTP